MTSRKASCSLLFHWWTRYCFFNTYPLGSFSL